MNETPSGLPAGCSLVPFDPATATADEWARFHAFRHLRHAERRPEDPIRPDADIEVLIRRPEPGGATRRWLALDGDAIVGTLTTNWVVDGPMLATNGHLLQASAAVLGPARRRGIGTALARVAAREMAALDRTVLTTGTEEDDGRRFLESLGATCKMEASENRLDLREVDWSMVETWAAEGPRRSPDTAFLVWRDRVPPGELPVYSAALSRLLNMMPKDDLDQGDIVLTPEMMAEFQSRIDAMHGALDTMVTRETDGAISGMTDVMYTPGQPDRIMQQFTGVDPKHRGRGLGKWLKAAMLLHVREAYPQACWVVTGNANSNDPMLSINHRLGFIAYRGESVYQIDRDALAARLAQRPM
ncbi:MAG: GNAT family N-acetyltransferase [Ardenticatenales bacterium]